MLMPQHQYWMIGLSLLLLTLLTQDISQSTAKNIEIEPIQHTQQHSNDLTPTPQGPTEIHPIEGAIGPEDYPEDVNPLTGLVVEDPAQLERRPIVAKISNAPPIVRPQSGIGQADIVFEHYAEGGLTRFSAIFYGQAPNRIGSIRSARLIDHEIVPMVDGLLAFSGASIGVETYIYGSDVVDPDFIHAPHRYIPPSEYAERAYKGVLFGPPYYWRDESIPVPHNLFADTGALWQMAAADGFAQRPHLNGLAFHPNPPDTATGSGLDLDLRYRATRVRWIYAPDEGVYRRYADGMAHFDAGTNRQISAQNVVIMFSEHVDTEIVESVWQGNISWSTQIQMWDQAPVILLRDGLRYDGYWTRTVRESFIALRTLEGDILYLKPGQTWFQVVRLPEQQNPDEEWVIIE